MSTSIMGQTASSYVDNFQPPCSSESQLIIHVLIFHDSRLLAVAASSTPDSFHLPTQRIAIEDFPNESLPQAVRKLVHIWTGLEHPDVEIDPMPVLEAACSVPIDPVEDAEQVEGAFVTHPGLLVKVNISHLGKPVQDLNRIFEQPIDVLPMVDPLRHEITWIDADHVRRMNPEVAPKLLVAARLAFDLCADVPRALQPGYSPKSSDGPFAGSERSELDLTGLAYCTFCAVRGHSSADCTRPVHATPTKRRQSSPAKEGMSDEMLSVSRIDQGVPKVGILRRHTGLEAVDANLRSVQEPALRAKKRIPSQLRNSKDTNHASIPALFHPTVQQTLQHQVVVFQPLICGSCSQTGHSAHECLRPTTELVCRRCHEYGHRSPLCPEIRCFECGGYGHKKVACRQSTDWIRGKCHNCFSDRHHTRNCPQHWRRQIRDRAERLGWRGRS